MIERADQSTILLPEKEVISKGMRTLDEIKKDIHTLIDEASEVIMSHPTTKRKQLALLMLATLSRSVHNQFVNIKQYLKT